MYLPMFKTCVYVFFVYVLFVVVVFLKLHIYLVFLTILMDKKPFYITKNYFGFSSLFRCCCGVSKLVVDLL